MKNEHIPAVMAALRRDVKRWTVPVVGRYAENPFTILISCILSLRTQDKTTDAASERLFARADTPARLARVPVRTIEKLIYPVGFYRTKARNIRKICRILLRQYGGLVPDEIDELLKLPGVGRKTANLVVTLGYRKPGICVDTHVHRITNRWGYVRTRTPEETEWALRRKLPPRYWIVLNDLLVTYGQNLCRPVSPRCELCSIRRFCRRVGVRGGRRKLSLDKPL
jgi:endonuclease III